MRNRSVMPIESRFVVNSAGESWKWAGSLPRSGSIKLQLFKPIEVKDRTARLWRP